MYKRYEEASLSGVPVGEALVSGSAEPENLLRADQQAQITKNWS